jgi:hypothetical protein
MKLVRVARKMPSNSLALFLHIFVHCSVKVKDLSDGLLFQEIRKTFIAPIKQSWSYSLRTITFVVGLLWRKSVFNSKAYPLESAG